MNLVVQITFNNGLGNLYCGLVNILDMVGKYKVLGYRCKLIFASNGCCGGNKYIDFCRFESIFDLKFFEKYFDEIVSLEHSITEKEYDGLVYHSTQFGPDYPGCHWWDIFLPNGEKLIFERVNGDVNSFLDKTFYPDIFPKFSEIIYDNIKNFKFDSTIDNVIQIRHFDYNIQPEESFQNDIMKINNYINKENEYFYVCSNNQYALDTLSKNEKVFIKTFENLEKLPNDHGYNFYNKKVSDEILYNRLVDNLSEMVNLSRYSNLFYYTSFSWISSFLYYSLVNNKNQKLINIKNII
jgi:hypothetical protein